MMNKLFDKKDKLGFMIISTSLKLWVESHLEVYSNFKF